MKFYGREEEIAILRKERELSHRQSRFTVVTGRRRVGKTELIDKALNDGTDDYLYLLFSRKNEKSLCRELLEAIEDQMGDRLPPLGNPERVAQLLRELVKVSRTRPFTIVLDEFQEMAVVNSGFYGELQAIWQDHAHLGRAPVRTQYGASATEAVLGCAFEEDFRRALSEISPRGSAGPLGDHGWRGAVCRLADGRRCLYPQGDAGSGLFTGIAFPRRGANCPGPGVRRRFDELLLDSQFDCDRPYAVQ